MCLVSFSTTESTDVERIRELLTGISKIASPGNNYVYDVILDKKEQKRIAKASTAQIVMSSDESRRIQLENVLATLDPFRENNNTSRIRINLR